MGYIQTLPNQFGIRQIGYFPRRLFNGNVASPSRSPDSKRGLALLIPSFARSALDFANCPFASNLTLSFLAMPRLGLSWLSGVIGLCLHLHG